MFKLIPYIYLAIGYYFIFNNYKIDNDYMILLMFFTLKIILYYKKCTISYIECKLRGVKKEQGYLYRLLDGIISVRHTIHFPILFILASYIYYYHFVIKGDGINFFLSNKN
jgi:hypothetical protein